MNRFITFLMLFITFGYNQVSFAQETPNPEEIAAVDDAFENNFYDALTQKAIENYDRAIISLQKCLDKEANNPVIYHELGKNYFALKNYAEAQNSFQKAIDLNPKERWYWNGLYDVFYETKDYNNAIRIVTKLIEFNKDFQDDLVSLYMYTNQKDKALALLSDMEQTTNLSQTMEYYKLQLERTPEINKPQKDDLEKEIQKNPLVEQNYIDLIYQYSESNNEEKAFEVAKKLADNIPNSDWAHVSLVKFYLNNNDGQNASNSMFKVLESAKIDIKIKHRVFNEFLIFASNNNEFLNNLEKAITLLDKDRSINVNKEVAKYFLKKNKLDEAVFYFEKSIENQPEDFESFEFLMQLLVQKKQYDKVDKYANQQLELYPTQASLYFYSGIALLNLNKTKEAISKLEEGVDYVVENPNLEKEFYTQLAKSYEKSGDLKKKEMYLSKSQNVK
ncbi:tetratricopeptide repeat protein [uncultured Flavobacterium sp.]|uniref:tetratricopeptide repeat protein n=1 Tax=uncultured Flavobacterium sp. TaxID=165435 RepID=UPI0030EC0D45